MGVVAQRDARGVQRSVSPLSPHKALLLGTSEARKSVGHVGVDVISEARTTLQACSVEGRVHRVVAKMMNLSGARAGGR
jgi:hypothetical protein